MYGEFFQRGQKLLTSKHLLLFRFPTPAVKSSFVERDFLWVKTIEIFLISPWKKRNIHFTYHNHHLHYIRIYTVLQVSLRNCRYRFCSDFLRHDEFWKTNFCPENDKNLSSDFEKFFFTASETLHFVRLAPRLVENKLKRSAIDASQKMYFCIRNFWKKCICLFTSVSLELFFNSS